MPISRCGTSITLVHSFRCKPPVIRYELNKILRFQPSTRLLCLTGADIISSYLSVFADGQSSNPSKYL